MVEQVGGEEERKEQLGELARLELAQSRNMIDKRERKETYESWNKVMRASKLHLLETCIPDTKRYNKELSALQGSVFRSTLLPADNRQIKGSGLVELVDEICGITGLGKYSPSPDA